MSGFSHFLLSFCILGYIFCSSRAWQVKMPSNIQGLAGSCLVIPCTFDYYKNPPQRPDRVVWYQYVNHGYPLVCDSWYPNDVIDIFRGKTRALTSSYEKKCSLQIYPVKSSHHRQRIYPWVDPENIGKYTHAFYDKTVTIEVVDRAEAPYITISGNMKVGQTVTVQCTVRHTCPTYPPTLRLNIPLLNPSLSHSTISDGTSKTTLTNTMFIERDHQTVECSVQHKGGITAKASKTLNAECSFSPLTISRTSYEFLEGQASKVTCTALYTCPKHVPVLTWNYASMPASSETRQSGSAEWKTVSTLTFTASGKDHGRSLTCYAQFSGGQRQERSITLRVKRNMLSRGWSFTTPSSITGMRGSCVIIPCTFTYSVPQPSHLRVIWYLFQSNGYSPVFGEGQSVISEFSGITCNVRHSCISDIPTLILSGVPGNEVISDTLVSDGIWERKVELTWAVKEEDQSVKCTVSYRGGQRATSELKLNVECPYDNIAMTERPGEVTEGVAKSVICSVSYKCKKNQPTIVWNYEDMRIKTRTKQNSSTTFITVSNLTFIGSLEDHGKSLTCTAQFVTGETSDSEILHIKPYVRDPFENDTLHDLAADVPFRFTALTHSCVVIPCSFPFQEDMPVTRGIWSKKNGDVIYHNAPSYVVDHFKGRTRILGDLNAGNCSLEIDDIKPFDNGPFCFHAERGNDRVRYNNSCVFVVMKASPAKPVMTSVPPEVDAGSTVTVSCSVTHTCPSHPPTFSWSVPSLTNKVTHTWTPEGIWETTSTITFRVAGGDEVKSLTCTAKSWLGKTKASTVQLTVKGSSIHPAAIAVSVLIVVILAAVFGVVLCKRR